MVVAGFVPVCAEDLEALDGAVEVDEAATGWESELEASLESCESDMPAAARRDEEEDGCRKERNGLGTGGPECEGSNAEEEDRCGEVKEVTCRSGDERESPWMRLGLCNFETALCQ